MSLTDTKNIMVFVEIVNSKPINVALEIIAKGKELAKARNEKLIAVLIGENLEDAASICEKSGADKIILIEKDVKLFEEYISLLEKTVEKYNPDAVLLGATQNGKDYAPALAKYFNISCLTDVININLDSDNLIFTTPVYGGTVLNDIVFENVRPQIATVRSGSFAKNTLDDGLKAEIIKEDFEVEKNILTKLIDIISEVSEVVNLEEAEVVVVGGRGMGSAEDFKLVEDLAEVCGGVVGATRPAIESDWIPKSHQVGQSGKFISPKLYIGCGVSGATQHITAIMGSEFILAINKDEDAPIFEIADAGIVGDVKVIIPLLIEAIKEIKES